MKLLIATGIYPPTVGGPATYSKLLADELPKHDVQVKVVSFDTVRHLPSGVRHAVYAFKLAQWARWADIVFAQDPVSVGYPAMLVSKLFRTPLVLKVVGDYAWEQGTQRFGVTDMLDTFVTKSDLYAESVLRLKRIQKKVAQHATRIIVPSAYLKRIVSAWGIASENITVVYNACEPSVADIPSRAQAQTLCNVTSPALLTAGRLVPWKGVVTLVTLLPELVKQFPTLTLYIAGDGPERQNIEYAITRTSMQHHVVMLGALPQKTLFSYIRATDVFVLNTAYEGFSHQLLETAALGTPIVTTRIGGNPELIEDGVSGLLVPYDDKDALAKAITRMLQDTTFATAAARKGMQVSTRFTAERMLQETHEVLYKVYANIV